MTAIFEALTKIVTFVNDNILWGIPMILIILGAGIFMTIRTKFLQVRKFSDSLSSTIVPTVKEMVHGKKQTKNKKEKSISQFEAFSSAIAGTVGTGNIVGVAGAILSGGPGAVFWMWVSAFFGMVTNYSENVLGLYYRKKDKEGSFSGGPMYYIEHGLGWRGLAKVFALCCTLAAVGMGMVQVNSISGTVQSAITTDPATKTVIAWIVGIVCFVLTALIVIGGIQRIGKVASMIVPFMVLLFIVMALIILGIHFTAIPAAFAVIFENAFSLKALGGGFLGYTIMMAMRYGFARGIFSNEAGLGSSVIAHSASDTKEPVKQGLWGIFEVFLDTFVICTLTALTLLTTGAYDFANFLGISADKTEVASSAFATNFGVFGTVAFTIILPLFAFTTILAWAYYGEKAAEYLFGSKRGGMAFKVLYVLLLIVGAVTSSAFVWALDDMFNAMMAIPNLIGVIGLSGMVVRITKNYFERRGGKDVEPMLSAYPELNEEFKKEITESKEHD
jgi:AGCS family alanine or glycine:cation symporter